MLPIPKGFSFATAAAGFRKSDRLDLGLVVSQSPARAAGVFTKNIFSAAPVVVGKELLEKSETARAVLINSGQANACTGVRGIVDCRKTMGLVAKALGIGEEEILPASTGVIGPHLLMDEWKAAAPVLAKNLGRSGPVEFARAIMTTDKYPKLAWKTLPATKDRGEVRVLGTAKGAGMICPNMATMLSVILCDARVDSEVWRSMIRRAADESFNRVTVDGDTSTNDTVYGLANGASGVEFAPGEEEALYQAVSEVMQSLAYMIIEDAEGGTKVMRIRVSGASDDSQAELAARAVGHSPLVKTAVYGKDPNWGRIVAALGRSGAGFDPEKVSVSMSGIELFCKGAPVQTDLDGLLAPRLRRRDIDIDIVLGQGEGSYELLASDLTHEYVSINAEYTT